MTPNQFQHASGRGTARDWKRSIKHHGTSLKSLISSRVLSVDPPHCRCAGCTGTAASAHNAGTLVRLPLLLATMYFEQLRRQTPVWVSPHQKD